MRNYIEMFFAKYSITHPVFGTTTGEIWRKTLDELDSEIENQRVSWTTAGWTFTIVLKMPAYFKTDKEHYGQFVVNASQAETLSGLANDEDPILTFTSPRHRERRKFYLVPIKKHRKS